MEENHHLSTTKPSLLYNRAITTNFKTLISEKNEENSTKKWYETAKGKVRQLRTLFESPKTLTLEPSLLSSSSKLLAAHHSFNRLKPKRSFLSDYNDVFSVLDDSKIRFPGTEDRVVVYFTSLRGVRRTYEDCYAVRMIFRSFNVFVDERDVSMDSGYRKELQGLLEEKNVVLPRVFIKGRYVGGVDVVKQLNETMELRKILKTLPVKDRRFVCDGCGDVRFLPCGSCCGSRKVFDEEEGVTKRCLECNENGLIRCPECCL